DDPADFFMADTAPEPTQEASVEKHDPPPERQRRNGHGKELTLEAGLPASIDAEKTILAAILLDPRAIKEVGLTISADDFSLDSHRRIFLRMAELADDGKAIDIVTLGARLSKFKEVEAVGGIAYLASVTQGVPRNLSVDAYCRLVKDKSVARRLMVLCSSAIARAADQSEDAMGTLEFLEAELASLRE